MAIDCFLGQQVSPTAAGDRCIMHCCTCEPRLSVRRTIVALCCPAQYIVRRRRHERYRVAPSWEDHLADRRCAWSTFPGEANYMYTSVVLGPSSS